jgi:hypothetical protein
MAKALPLILVGLAIAYGGVAELMIWLRSRSRRRRMPGTCRPRRRECLSGLLTIQP